MFELTCKMHPVKRLLARLGSFLVLIVFLMGTISSSTRAQKGSIDLRIELKEIVTQAQALSLSTLGVDRRGQGQHVASLIITNNTDRKLEELYFHIVVKNTNVGVIAELDQTQGNPFSLRPRQVIRASNNDIQNGIPGISTELHFEGGLTNEGEDFVNSLEGQTSLPDDVYTLTLEVYHGSNRLNGGEKWASSSASIGKAPLSTSRDIYINSPGGEVESGAEFVINTSNPQFNWSGNAGDKFRVVIVEDAESESPESLIQKAKSTKPVIIDNQNVGNTLLEYEMADVRLSNSSFRYPSSGVNKLDPGKRYLWQVTTLVETPDGQQELTSEIWAFTIAETGPSEQTEMDKETRQALRNLLEGQQFNMIQGQDMNLESVVINGTRYSGEEMLKKLKEFVERARRGEITIKND